MIFLSTKQLLNRKYNFGHYVGHFDNSTRERVEKFI